MIRPRVITFNVVSVDSRLTMAPGVNLMAGDERWSAMTAGIDDALPWPMELHQPEMTLEGSGSFLPDARAQEPPPASPPPEGEHYLPAEIIDVPGRRWFTVVDGRGAVDLQYAQWPGEESSGWYALVLTSSAASADHLALLRSRGIPYLRVGERQVHLGRALELAHELLGVRTAVCTGGGRLGGALLRQGLVDEVDLEVLPWVIGGRGTPALFDAPPLAPDEWPSRLELLANDALPDGRLRLRYRVTRGGEAGRSAGSSRARPHV